MKYLSQIFSLQAVTLVIFLSLFAVIGLSSPGEVNALECSELPQVQVDKTGGAGCKAYCQPEGEEEFKRAYWAECTNTSQVCCVPVETEPPVFCDELSGADLLSYPACALGELGTLISFIVEWVIVGAAILSLLALLIGGFYIITARDDTQQYERGRNTILWAMIGLIVAGGMFMFMQLLGSVFGVPIFGGGIVNIAYAQEEQADQQALLQIQGEVTNSAEELISGVEVSLFWKNEGVWELWPAQEFDNQRNPVLTDVFGRYSFRVPPGEYYITAKEENYFQFKGDSFVIEDAPKVYDVQLEAAPKFWPFFLAIGGVLLIGLSTYYVVQKVSTWRERQNLKNRLWRQIKGDETGEDETENSETKKST